MKATSDIYIHIVLTTLELEIECFCRRTRSSSCVENVIFVHKAVSNMENIQPILFIHQSQQQSNTKPISHTIIIIISFSHRSLSLCVMHCVHWMHVLVYADMQNSISHLLASSEWNPNSAQRTWFPKIIILFFFCFAAQQHASVCFFSPWLYTRIVIYYSIFTFFFVGWKMVWYSQTLCVFEFMCTKVCGMMWCDVWAFEVQSIQVHNFV